MPRRRTLAAEVAFSMECTEALLPHLPYLLQDLPSLSGAEDEVVAVLAEAGFPQGGALLDLGCGRGDIALRAARAFDATVTGYDGQAPFVAAAVEAARLAGLADHVKFAAADLRQALAGPARYDAALMIAVGPVLGGPAATVGALRTVVRPGGLMVIDDAYLDEAAAGQGPPSPAWEDYAGLVATEAGLTAHGDAIVARRVPSTAGAAFDALCLEAIPRRAAELAGRDPALGSLLDAYVKGQAEEIAFMAGPVVPALWALRRAV